MNLIKIDLIEVTWRSSGTTYGYTANDNFCTTTHLNVWKDGFPSTEEVILRQLRQDAEEDEVLYILLDAAETMGLVLDGKVIEWKTIEWIFVDSKYNSELEKLDAHQMHNG